MRCRHPLGDTSQATAPSSSWTCWAVSNISPADGRVASGEQTSGHPVQGEWIATQELNDVGE